MNGEPWAFALRDAVKAGTTPVFVDSETRKESEDALRVGASERVRATVASTAALCTSAARCPVV